MINNKKKHYRKFIRFSCYFIILATVIASLFISFWPEEHIQYSYDKDKSYDKIYVINLDESTERWSKISKQLDAIGIEYQRFSAVDGYKVMIQDLEAGKSFLGQDIRNKTARIEKSKLYKIFCTSGNKKLEFNYTGSFNHIEETISAGEIGLWCSYMLLWKDIADNNEQKVIILEDDIVITDPDFKKKLEDFTTHVPDSFDLAYINLAHFKGTQIPLPNNQYVNRFTPNSKGFGTWSIMYSNKAVKKLLSLDCYSNAIDNLLWSLTTGLFDGHPECKNRAGTFESYVTSKDLLDITKDNSIIHKMGRSFDSNN